MQVVTHTPDRLVLRERHTVLAAICWGCAALLVWGISNKWTELDQAAVWGMGLTSVAFAGVAVHFLRPAIWRFDRRANLFAWSTPGLFRSVTGSAPLDSIKRVRVDTSYGDDGNCYRVVAEAAGTVVPFHPTYASGDMGRFQRRVDLVRDWLDQ